MFYKLRECIMHACVNRAHCADKTHTCILLYSYYSIIAHIGHPKNPLNMYAGLTLLTLITMRI